MRSKRVTPESKKPPEIGETSHISGRSTEDIQASIVREIVDARLSHGFSQKKLQTTSGVQQAVIARLETGTTDPKLSTIVRILHTLDMTLAVVPLNTKHNNQR